MSTLANLQPKRQTFIPGRQARPATNMPNRPGIDPNLVPGPDTSGSIPQPAVYPVHPAQQGPSYAPPSNAAYEGWRPRQQQGGGIKQQTAIPFDKLKNILKQAGQRRQQGR